MGAHFVANILKYNIKSSNFASRRLVMESPFLTLLEWAAERGGREGGKETAPCCPTSMCGEEVGV